ncbi:MAG: hypothetical protein Rubg2KO_18290 [Rubricoccaceae bacterium]
MRSAVLALCLLGLVLAAPAQSQAIADRPGQQAPVSVYASPETPTLKQLFNAQTLRVSQSYEFSYAGGGAGTMGLGVYTASLRWQPNARLAGRVDLGVAHSPFSSGLYESALGANSEQPRVFLRNAELAWKPTESSMVRFQVQQSPYGAYASPYGASPYGAGRYTPYGSSFGAQVGSSNSDALFWRDAE